MPSTKSLPDILIQTALDHSDHPAGAVGSLMRAAATILERTLGPTEAINLMREMVTDAAVHHGRMQALPLTRIQ
jgi:hypothetical protein